MESDKKENEVELAKPTRFMDMDYYVIMFDVVKLYTFNYSQWKRINKGDFELLLLRSTTEMQADGKCYEILERLSFQKFTTLEKGMFVIVKVKEVLPCNVITE